MLSPLSLLVVIQHSRKRDQRTGVLVGVQVGGRAGMLLLSNTSLAPQLDLPRGAAAERPALDGRGARRDPGGVHCAEGHARGSEPGRHPRGMRTISFSSTANASPATVSAPSPAPQAPHAVARPAPCCAAAATSLLVVAVAYAAPSPPCPPRRRRRTRRRRPRPPARTRRPRASR